MAALKLMGKWGVPVATAVAVPLFGPVVSADSGGKESTKVTSRMIRPSELPIYEEPEEVLDFEYHGRDRTSLEEGVGTVRKEIEGLIEATRTTREKVVHICETGKAHTMATVDMVGNLQLPGASVDYITDEENMLARAGAITVGGLAGLVLGARKKGGFVKKALYTSTGIAGTASLCYPRQAYQISQEAYNGAKDYATIGYNFVAGVKPQSKVADPNEPKKVPPEEPSPKAEEPPPTMDSPPAPAEASESEGDEVRSVLHQALPEEKSPAPVDSLVQQTSDVMQWGFRLTDKTSSAASVPDESIPLAEATVPEGFGSIADTDNNDDVKTSSDLVITEEKPVEDLKEEESAEVKVIDIIDTVTEDIAEKVGEDIIEESAKAVHEIVSEALEHVDEVVEIADKVEEVTEKVSTMIDKVQDVLEVADKAAEETPGMTDDMLVDVTSAVVGGVEKVVDAVNVVAGKVEDIAEIVQSEFREVKTEAAELIASEEKREEFVEKVVDYVKEIVPEELDVAEELTTVTDENASEMKEVEKLTELTEELEVPAEAKEPDVVSDVLEKITEPVAEIVTDEGKSVVEVTEPATESLEQIDKSEPVASEAIEPIAAVVEQEATLIDTSGSVIAEKESDMPILEQETAVSTPEIADPQVRIDEPEPAKKPSLFDRILNMFSEDKSEKVSSNNKSITLSEERAVDDVKAGPIEEETEEKGTMEEAVLKVAEDVVEKIGEVVVEKVAEPVEVISEEVEKDASVVAETATAIEETSEEVAKVIEITENIAEAAAKAAEEVPQIPEIVETVVDRIEEVAKEAETIVDTVALVAEKVEEFAEEVKKEAEAVEAKANELIASEEKREELVGEVIDFIVEEITGEQVQPEKHAEPDPVSEVSTEASPSTTDVEELKVSTEADPSTIDVEELKVLDEAVVVELTPTKKDGLFDKLLNLFKEKGSDTTPKPESPLTVPVAEPSVAEAAIEVKTEGVEAPVEVKSGEVEVPVELNLEQEEAAIEVKPESVPENEVKENETMSKEVGSPDIVEDLPQKEGLIDKLVNIFSSDEEKKELTKVSVEPVLAEAVLEGKKELESEEVEAPNEMTSKQEEATIEVPSEPDVEVKDTVLATVEVSSPDVAEVAPQKEGLIDKLVNIFSSDEEKKEEDTVVVEPEVLVKESVAEPTLAEAVSEVKTEDESSVEVKSEGVETSKQEEANIEVQPEPAVEVKDTVSATVEVSSLDVAEVAPQKEGFIDKLASIFSSDEENKEVNTGIVEPEVLIKEPVAAEPNVAEAVSEVKTEAEPLVEVKSEGVEIPAEVTSKQEEATIEVQSELDTEVKETLSGTAEVSSSDASEVPSQKEGLLDKLASIFSSDEEKKEAISEAVEPEVQLSDPVPESNMADTVTEVESKAVEALDEITVKVVEVPGEVKSEVESGKVEESIPVIGEVSSSDVAEAPPQKEGLINKLVSIFSSDEKKEVTTEAVVASESTVKGSVAEVDVTDPVTEVKTEVVPVTDGKSTVDLISEPETDAEPLLEVNSEAKPVDEPAVEVKLEEAAPVIIETSPEAIIESSPKQEGLINKLVNIFSSEDEKKEVKDDISDPGSKEQILEKSEEPEVKVPEPEVKETIVDPNAELGTPVADLKTQEPDVGLDVKEVIKSETEELPVEAEKTGLIHRLADIFSSDKSSDVDVSPVPEVEIKESISKPEVVEPIAEAEPEIKEQEAQESIVIEEKDITEPQAEAMLSTEMKEEATKEEKEGLVDKLAKLFSSEKSSEEVENSKPEIDTAPTEEPVKEATAPTEEPVKEPTSESVVETETSKETGTEATVVIEEEKETFPGTDTVTVEKEPVQSGGLFGKLADFFSKDEVKTEIPTPTESVTPVLLEESTEQSTEEKIEVAADFVVVDYSDVKDDSIEVQSPGVKAEDEAISGGSITEKRESLVDKLVSFISGGDKKEESSIPTAITESDATPTAELIAPDEPAEGSTTEGTSEMESSAPNESPAASSEVPVLEVKDKSLFGRLAEIVSGSDKKAEESQEEKQSTSTQDTETVVSPELLPSEVPKEDEQQPLSEPVETKSSIFDRVANMFSKDNDESVLVEREQSPDSSQVPDSSESKAASDEEDSDVFVVVSKPSSPFSETSTQEAGRQQAEEATGWLQGSWFRSSTSVTQEGKDVIIKVDEKKPEEDHGQSNPEDSDMYTTRS